MVATILTMLYPQRVPIPLRYFGTLSHGSSTFLGVLALLFTFGVAVCRANLGETEAQCITKYGPEFEVQDRLGFDVIGDKAASFNLHTLKGSFVMKVIFLNGIDVFEKITNTDTSHDISEDEKQAILDSESAGLKWNKQASAYHTDRSDITSIREDWLRGDGANAICWMSGKLKANHGWDEIDLSTKEYASEQRELDRQNGAPR
jgi:hypothetical protein